MAGDWIKIRSNIKDDPDVVVMAGKLATDEFSIVGRLHAVWAWLDQHSKDGTNVRITSAYLDRLVACPGFADALRTVGWLDGRDGSLTFPNFDRHNGESAKRRAVEAKRKAEQRSGNSGGGTNVPTSVPPKPGPEKRREEKSTEEPISAHRRRPSVEEAKRAASLIGITAEEAEEWWHAREGSEWMKGTAGGGTTPVGHNWQSDLRSFVTRMRERKTSETTKPQGKRPMSSFEIQQRIEAVNGRFQRIEANTENYRLEWQGEKQVRVYTPKARAELDQLKATKEQLKKMLTEVPK